MAKRESYRRRKRHQKRIGMTNTRNLALSKMGRNGVIL